MSDVLNPACVFFGRELQRKRAALELTQEELASKLGCTPGWVSKMESGKKISKDSADDLDTFFKTDGIFFRMWELSKEIELHAAVPPGYPEYLTREKAATSVRKFDGYLVPGLLQTEAYASAVLSANEFPDMADRLLAERLTRQEIFTKPNAPHCFFAIDEVALRRRVGNAEIMRAQYEALLRASELPNVTIVVIPENTGYYPGLAGSFTVLGMEDGSHMAYTESAGAGMLIGERARVAKYLLRYETLVGYALPVTESLALIRKLMEEL
ncbi:helix-turn-helix domain-containing protein [Actinomadura oligospora]|uniref:helix-turn-helix domain-containing protein n=1 Tax=Actinomadura oligospora TaxID=111804 RepID=UPI00047EAFF1|nr:helix-turn-helix transcriptional regulator [Actinomadura oligospora]